MGAFPGVQDIINATFEYAGTGLPVYYRMLNSDPAPFEELVELGFEKTVAQGGGTNDILVLPQPRVINVSVQQIGISAGTLNLNETSRKFVISNTFVKKMMEIYPEIPEQEWVFDGWHRFVGIVYEQTLYRVASYSHLEVGGATVSWRLICSAVRTQA